MTDNRTTKVVLDVVGGQVTENQVCPECGNKDIVYVYERGERVCINCGLVIEEKIVDTQPEYRAYSQEQRNARERVGSPLTGLKHDFGMSTEIKVSNRDSKGKLLPPERINELRKFKWIQNRENKSKIRNLKKALREIKKLTSQLELPETIAESTSFYYRKALKKNLIRGRSISCMVAATLYLAARKQDIPITIKDLEQASNENRKAIARCFRILVRELDIKTDLSDPVQLIPRLASDLDLTTETKQLAIEITQNINKKKLHTGKTPMSIAAAAVYVACLQTGERRTQQMVAKAAKTTPVTLRNRVKEIMEATEIDLVIKRGAAATPVYFKKKWKF